MFNLISIHPPKYYAHTDPAVFLTEWRGIVEVND